MRTYSLFVSISDPGSFLDAPPPELIDTKSIGVAPNTVWELHVAENGFLTLRPAADATGWSVVVAIPQGTSSRVLSTTHHPTLEAVCDQLATLDQERIGGRFSVSLHRAGAPHGRTDDQPHDPTACVAAWRHRDWDPAPDDAPDDARSRAVPHAIPFRTWGPEVWTETMIGLGLGLNGRALRVGC